MALNLVSVIGRLVLPTPVYSRLSASKVAQRVASGSLWIFLGAAVHRILVLATMIVVARLLGPSSFGEFGLIQATVGVAGLMAGIGLGNTATRFVAESASTDPSRAATVISLLTVVMIGMLLAACAILAASSSLVADFFLAAPHLRIALMWASLLLASNVLRGVQSGILAGFERFNLIAKLNVVEGVLTVTIAVALAKYLGVIGAVIGLATSGIAAWVIGQFGLAKEMRERDIAISYAGCWHSWPILTRYGLPNLLANLVVTPVTWLAMVFLAKSGGGHAEVGLYNGAYQWFGPVIFLPMVVFSATVPVLVQEWEGRRRRRFQALIRALCAAALAFALPPAVLIGLFSQELMSIYGGEYSTAWPVLVVLMVSVPFYTLARIAAGALLTMNRAWSTLWPNITWGAVLLGLAVWLVPEHGAFGLAIAFLVASVVLAGANLLLLVVGVCEGPEDDEPQAEK